MGSITARACAPLLCLGATCVHAQEMEPRAYSPSPTGAHFLVVGVTRSTGGVVFDASTPYDDVEARIDAPMLAYGQTFAWFGRSASVLLAAPYVVGDISGNVGEDREEIRRSGPADLRMKLAVNLIGGPALTSTEFAQREPTPTLGISLAVIAPTGSYDSAKLINIGANRWAFKPEIGYSQPWGRWSFEVYAGAWLFTDNDEFFGGTHREQAPIGALQGHVGYTIKPRLWLAFDNTFYTGGRSETNGVRNSDEQSSTRIGLTASLPVGARQSVKLSWSDGVATRTGTDFITYGLAWQYTWID